MILRLLGNDADALAFILEDAIQSAHEETLEGEDKEGAAELLESALRLLRQLDSDSPIFDADVKAGQPVDWDNIFAEEATAETDQEPVQP